MSRGCCFGCLATSVVLLLALGVAVYVLDQAFSVFSPAARVALDQRYGTDYPVVARLDLSSEFLKEVTGRAVGRQPWFIELFWPHEAYFFVEVDEENLRNEMTLSVSTRRMGSFLSMIFPVGEDVRLGGGYSVSSASLDDSGVLMVLADTPIADETMAATADWGADVEPYELAREHLFELVVDNSRGHGYLALRRLFDPDPEPGPDAEEPPLTDEQVEELFRTMGALRVQADVFENRAMEVVIESRFADEEAAARGLELLSEWRTHWEESLNQDNAALEGEFAREGAEVRGEFLLSDIDDVMVEETQERVQELEEATP